jgi:hypothetical protein
MMTEAVLQQAPPTAQATPVGIVGEFTDVNTLISAAETIRDAGYRKWDVHTPYPVHGLDKTMGIRRSILTYISFAGMAGGLTTAVGMQWWMNAYDYKLNIGGKEFFNWQFSMPLDFELSILGTAIFTVLGLFALCRIPTWWNRYQNDESFKKATDDTFVVTVDIEDDRYSPEGTQDLLRRLGATNVHIVTAAS